MAPALWSRCRAPDGFYHMRVCVCFPSIFFFSYHSLIDSICYGCMCATAGICICDGCEHAEHVCEKSNKAALSICVGVFVDFFLLL